MANQKADQVDIDPDGDVIFICTLRKISPLRLRVSSKVVSLASPVLKAMLSPHFREGTTLATASYVEIELPEDDAKTMKTLFLIMHSKNDRLGSMVNLKVLAETVDKYDCVAAVGTAAYYWISKAMENADEDDLQDLLHYAYLLRQHELFATIARRLVCYNQSPILGKPGVLTDVYCKYTETCFSNTLLT
ncbi:uncharacterized protein MYCFIDRAFT_35290 [Pseudocercospora fijiensis CIRAD86]|uniref:BTB domain-containing protein n=1 Tax=Pseudocercospora fijiensis (strain CIRAD86) TaxID=383855 RepID=N1QC20_PSEFD|nr:uncharacterized protein MYCFIDRAFT_35290 [Pseudocercospora fijiensis CIRAD86]EME88862.1 hypothetical protein MYCFIDRAFT_35290 [Pseudocercospora fijiensis CIRAD86]